MVLTVVPNVLFVCLQLAEAEARHTGLQGAVVVVLRSMMGQENSLRKELGQLAAELDASLLARGNQPAQRSASDPAEPSQLQLQKPKCGRRKCSTRNILAQDAGLKTQDSGCCWQGLEVGRPKTDQIQDAYSCVCHHAQSPTLTRRNNSRYQGMELGEPSSVSQQQGSCTAVQDQLQPHPGRCE